MTNIYLRLFPDVIFGGIWNLWRHSGLDALPNIVEGWSLLNFSAEPVKGLIQGIEVSKQ